MVILADTPQEVLNAAFSSYTGYFSYHTHYSPCKETCFTTLCGYPYEYIGMDTSYPIEDYLALWNTEYPNLKISVSLHPYQRDAFGSTSRFSSEGEHLYGVFKIEYYKTFAKLVPRAWTKPLLPLRFFSPSYLHTKPCTKVISLKQVWKMGIHRGKYNLCKYDYDFKQLFGALNDPLFVKEYSTNIQRFMREQTDFFTSLKNLIERRYAS